MKRKNLKMFNSLVVVMLLFTFVFLTGITAEAKSVEKGEIKEKIVVIDPGCQSIDSKEKESVGPGAWSWVADDMVGAKGANSGVPEYEINLKIARKVEKALSDKGYRVELTRTSNDVDMSNLERSMVPNTLAADLYISIHASADNKKSSGITVTCETADNPYNFSQYSQCRLLADVLKGSLEATTENANHEIVESDEIIGINWCAVPNAIVRVGNLNNETDDERLNSEDYQQKIVDGIVAGVDSYFAQK